VTFFSCQKLDNCAPAYLRASDYVRTEKAGQALKISLLEIENSARVGVEGRWVTREPQHSKTGVPRGSGLALGPVVDRPTLLEETPEVGFTQWYVL